jgi:hypothetical protein
MQCRRQSTIAKEEEEGIWEEEEVWRRSRKVYTKARGKA